MSQIRTGWIRILVVPLQNLTPPSLDSIGEASGYPKYLITPLTNLKMSFLSKNSENHPVLERTSLCLRGPTFRKRKLRLGKSDSVDPPKHPRALSGLEP